MSRNDKLDQFDHLVDELKQEAERPSAIDDTFKQNLRRQLLNEYEQPGFSFATLGRWAGTAVALSVLAFIVVYAWGVLAQPSTTGAPVSVTRPVQPAEEPEPEDVVITAVPEAALSSFADAPLLTLHTLSATQVEPGDSLAVTLFWEGEAAANSKWRFTSRTVMANCLASMTHRWPI